MGGEPVLEGLVCWLSMVSLPYSVGSSRLHPISAGGMQMVSMRSHNSQQLHMGPAGNQPTNNLDRLQLRVKLCHLAGTCRPGATCCRFLPSLKFAIRPQ